MRPLLSLSFPKPQLEQLQHGCLNEWEKEFVRSCRVTLLRQGRNEKVEVERGLFPLYPARLLALVYACGKRCCTDRQVSFDTLSALIAVSTNSFFLNLSKKKEIITKQMRGKV